MLSPVCVDKVYLACGSTDMRKSIDSLAAIVQQSFALDPFSTALFMFCNKSRDKIKILQWDHNGFWCSSEKASSEQLSFFNEAEKEANDGVLEPAIEKITYKRRKREGYREENIKDLPVE